MAQPKSNSTRPLNHLLATLSAADFDLMRSRLEPVVLRLRLSIEEPNRPIKQVYFPDSGIISVVAVGPGARQVEVALIGHEGMTGIAVVMGDDRSPHQTYVQVAGCGMRIAAEHMLQVMHESPSLRFSFLRFAQAYAIQTAHCAVANARGKLEEQLARWLLMAHDRLEGNRLPLTHEFLALMLGVRRAGVTTTLRGLERRQLVRTGRKLITVLDRKGLIEIANGLYGVPEREYRRLTGWSAPATKA